MPLVTICQHTASSSDTKARKELVDSLAKRILSDLYGTNAKVLTMQDHVERKVLRERQRSFANHPSNYGQPDLAS